MPDADLKSLFQSLQKAKRFVLIGPPTVKHWTQATLTPLFQHSNIHVDTSFKAGDTIAFFNPKFVTSTKLQKAQAMGVTTHPYDALYQLADTLLESSKDGHPPFEDQLKPQPTPTPPEPKKAPSPKTLKPTPDGTYLVPPGIYAPQWFPEIQPKVLNQDPTPPVKDYAAIAYEWINNSLSNFGGQTLKALSLIERQLIEDLCLEVKLGKGKAAVLYRGVGGSSGHPAAVAKYWEMSVGDTIIKPAFISSTWSQKSAKEFAEWDRKNTTKRRVMLVMDATSVKGVKIKFRGEAELLLPPGTRMHITNTFSAQDSDTKRILHLKLDLDPDMKAPKPLGHHATTTKAELISLGRTFIMPDDGQP